MKKQYIVNDKIVLCSIDLQATELCTILNLMSYKYESEIKNKRTKNR